ncbi:hypothetical protein [Clostridium sp.]|uniref:hypothetical protein n=1 Tax=Clostridium sp. TaxID=1506 RepID=UPI003D6D615F
MKKKVIIAIILVVLIICSVSLYSVIKEKTLPIYTMSEYGMDITKDNIKYSLELKFDIDKSPKRVGKRIGKGEFGGEKFDIYRDKENQEYIISNSEIHQGYIWYKAVKKP